LFSEFTPNPSATIYRDESRRQKYRPRTSADVLAMIGELAYGMTQQIASKSEELRRLRNLVDNMQVPHTCFLKILSYLCGLIWLERAMLLTTFFGC